MAGLENISLLLSLICVPLSIIFFTFGFINRQRETLSNNKSPSSSAVNTTSRIDFIGTVIVVISIVFLTLTIISRGIQTGHGPFSNMYEFAIAFALGVLVAGVIFKWKYKTGSVLNIVLILALLLLIFARIQYSRPGTLVPALQQSALLSAHVASAVVAYGTLAIGFAAAILYIIQSRRKSPWLPSLEVLDSMSSRSVMISFPFLTLLIVLGALWADIAWGKYWSWDPKETASLVTWLIYAAYLHIRIMKGWRGSRTALVLIIGFVAVLLTFFGNYIFSGMHSYK
jgi:cytochrome c-type biogenesis protein CcsB